MKITIKESKVEKEEYRIGDYEVGTVIEINDDVKVKAVVINSYDEIGMRYVEDSKALLILTSKCRDNWYQIASSYLDKFKQGNFKVLGKIDEIIVG